MRPTEYCGWNNRKREIWDNLAPFTAVLSPQDPALKRDPKYFCDKGCEICGNARAETLLPILGQQNVLLWVGVDCSSGLLSKDLARRLKVLANYQGQQKDHELVPTFLRQGALQSLSLSTRHPKPNSRKRYEFVFSEYRGYLGNYWLVKLRHGSFYQLLDLQRAKQELAFNTLEDAKDFTYYFITDFWRPKSDCDPELKKAKVQKYEDALNEWLSRGIPVYTF